MKHRMPSLIVLALLLSCGCSPSSEVKRLSGTWGIESAERLAQRLGQEPIHLAGEAAEIDKPKMKIEFGRNGTLKTFTELGAISPPPKQGKWKLVGSAEEGARITIECDLAGQVTEHEVRFIDADTIELIPPNMAGTRQMLRFIRMEAR